MSSMLSDKMLGALNDQINAEYFSSYMYLSMSAFLCSRDLQGFAHWMRVQAQEELGHALKFYDHVLERGGRVHLSEVKAPPSDWPSPSAVFQAAYEHECRVTSLIHNLVDLAVAEKDHATNSFLKWFVDEQVEEEARADAIVQKLKMIGDHAGGLLILDQQLGERKG